MSHSLSYAELIALNKALVAYGFSPAKAYEIALDAARKDAYALKWVEIIRSSLTFKGAKAP